MNVFRDNTIEVVANLYVGLHVLQKCDGDDKEKKREIVVLEMKRSQAINIGLTKLPPVRTLKQAILNMDSAVIDREGIDVSVACCYCWLQFANIVVIL